MINLSELSNLRLFIAGLTFHTVLFFLIQKLIPFFTDLIILSIQFTR